MNPRPATVVPGIGPNTAGSGTAAVTAAEEAPPPGGQGTGFDYDVVLVGGGIMSATLATLLRLVEPTWTITLVERLDELAGESSGPWNNAGTGHSALCELNYSPQMSDGSVDVTQAVKVNEQFQLSRQLWAHLATTGQLPDPASFIRPTPHVSFVWGEQNVEYLRRRHAALAAHPLFTGLEFTDDPETIGSWAPLLTRGRDTSVPVAATRALEGTDVDFGSLTRALVSAAERAGALDVVLGTEVTSLHRVSGGWRVRGRAAGSRTGRLLGRRNRARRFEATARFVFVGAGGQALTLLQRSRIPEIRGYGGFPVSGQFWRTSAPEVVSCHGAKVYGKAPVGAPPMSVPHLDTRVVNGQPSVMFGPYAGFSPRFLKNGSLLDLVRSVRLHNIFPMLQVAARNVSLMTYLVSQVTASKRAQLAELQAFYPEADAADWEKIAAGQRVQVIKRVPGKGGVLQFGTEVVSSADGTIAGLLGASPGASTAVAAMLEVMGRAFPDRLTGWEPALRDAMPGYGIKLGDHPDLARDLVDRTRGDLGLDDRAHVTKRRPAEDLTQPAA